MEVSPGPPPPTEKKVEDLGGQIPCELAIVRNRKHHPLCQRTVCWMVCWLMRWQVVLCCGVLCCAALCAVRCALCAVRSAQCAVRSAQCAVGSALCAVVLLLLLRLLLRLLLLLLLLSRPMPMTSHSTQYDLLSKVLGGHDLLTRVWRIS